MGHSILSWIILLGLIVFTSSVWLHQTTDKALEHSQHGKTRCRNDSIIALTANAFDEDVQLSLQAGINAHLSKPVEADTLIRILGGKLEVSIN